MTKMEQLGRIYLELRSVEQQISVLYAQKKRLMQQAELVYESMLNETRKGKTIEGGLE